MNLEEMISRVPECGCWIWLGVIQGNGYGKYGKQLAHRLIYEKAKGTVPNGLQLDHLCRVRSCVNPDHLEPVTQRENILRGDSFSAKNAAKTSCPSGHPYTKENTRIRANGYRECRECRKAALRKRYSERKYLWTQKYNPKLSAKRLAQRRANV